MKELNSALLTDNADTNTSLACTSVQPAGGIDSINFRRTMSRLAAGVSIITTISQDGHKPGLTAVAVSPLSLDPPLGLVCINNLLRAIAPLQARNPFIVQPRFSPSKVF